MHKLTMQSPLPALNSTVSQLKVMELEDLIVVICPTGSGIPSRVLVLIPSLMGPSPAVVQTATLTVYEVYDPSPVIL